MIDLTRPVYAGCLYVEGTNENARIDNCPQYTLKKVPSDSDKNGFRIRVSYTSDDKESSFIKTYNSDGLHTTDNSTLQNNRLGNELSNIETAQ